MVLKDFCTWHKVKPHVISLRITINLNGYLSAIRNSSRRAIDSVNKFSKFSSIIPSLSCNHCHSSWITIPTPIQLRIISNLYVNIYACYSRQGLIENRTLIGYKIVQFETGYDGFYCRPVQLNVRTSVTAGPPDCVINQRVQTGPWHPPNST